MDEPRRPVSSLSEHIHVGKSVRRKEDLRFITGAAQHVADMELPGMAHAVVLRSPLAHARIQNIDSTVAQQRSGVLGVFTAVDVEGKIPPFVEDSRQSISSQLAQQIALAVKKCPMKVLAADRVLYVGQPVAVLVATSDRLAVDALEDIDVDYDPLPVVADVTKATDEGAPVLHPELGDNVHSRFSVETGNVDKAFAEADHTFVEEIQIGRQIASALETRGVLATCEPGDQRVTVWCTNNKPYQVRSFISEMLGLPAANVRVVGPDMGGSFGGGIFPEEILVPFLAMELARPIRWVERRRENLSVTSHGRDQVHEVAVAFNGDGTIMALRDRFKMDCGAYNPYAITVSYNTVAHLRGQFKIDNFSVEHISVLTNKPPVTPVRGAGRPEGTFVIERVLERVARELNMDSLEVRMRNLIRSEEMPYDMGIPYGDGKPLKYEQADFPAQVREALELFGYTQWRQRQLEARESGRSIGIGTASSIEGSGHGPFEAAIARVDESGSVTVFSGARPHGQGHETALAQVAADQLGLDPEHVLIRAGDTWHTPEGRGSYASRTAVTAGNAVFMATAKLRAKILALAAHLLEIDPEDLVMDGGTVRPRGVPVHALSFAELAQAALPGPNSRLPEGMEPLLEAQHFFVPPGPTIGSATHVVAVEVDIDTGVVKLLRYVAVHECGTMINPMIVEGQIHGGVVHGIGNALFEEALYDEHGQLVTTTFMDYLLPTSTSVPPIIVGHQSFPSTLNPLGVKGVGEGGAIASPAAVVNGIEDALKPLPVRISRLPVSPQRLLQLVKEAHHGTAGFPNPSSAATTN